jgi:protease-4
MRQFIKYTLASLTGSLLFFLLLGFLLTMGAIGLVGVLLASVTRGGDPPTVADRTLLIYNLSTPISDGPAPLDPTAALLGSPAPVGLPLRQAVLALEAAAADPQIVGLYLQGGATVGTGLANQMELYQAIQAFREAGKPVIAYDATWSEREYHLAALADTVYLNPLGSLEMNGLYAEIMYQAEALENLGVGVQVTRVGEYKSAVEPFVLDAMSPEERAQTQQLLDDVWQTMVADMAAPRSLQPQQFQTIADNQGFLFGEEAQAANLVDEMAYEDEVVDALRELTGQSGDRDGNSPDAGIRQISLARYARTVSDELVTRRSNNHIAVVYAEGSIVDGESGRGFGQPTVIAGNTLARQLRQLRYNDNVKAVVLRINSPGGSATASEIILRELQLLQEADKPVVVSMGNLAASGGYWIAALADTIVAQPTTITGSIGVFSLFLNLEDLGDKVGVSWDGVKTGELADIFSATRPKTDQELAILQRAVDNIYTTFLDRVEEGRNLPRDTVETIAQGRVWSGTAAQDIGLVDELGGLTQAIAIAADLAELGDDWRLQEYPEPEGWQRFFSLFEPQSVRSPWTLPQITDAPDPLTAQLLHFLDDLSLLQTLNDPRGLYLLMPYQLRFR